MFASGVPTAEKPTAKRYYLMSHGPNAEDQGEAWKSYKQYLGKSVISL